MKVQKEKDSSVDGFEVERFLWHGTDSDTASKICRKEFNRNS